MENFAQSYLFAHSHTKPHKAEAGFDQKARTGPTPLLSQPAAVLAPGSRWHRARGPGRQLGSCVGSVPNKAQT